jgi:TatD DNase family protein
VRLVDSHAHLQAHRFEPDAMAVLDAARDSGVERLLAPGWDVDSSRASVALAARTFADAGVGIHPHVAATIDDGTWAEIAALARDPSVVAIGETGLDYDRGFSPRDVQLAGLRRHIELALELGKPLVLHCRSRAGEADAQNDLIRELLAGGVADRARRGAFGARPPGVLHSFSGPVDYAVKALGLGFAVSFSGLVFRDGEQASADVARIVPAGQVLVETDSPYLSPPGAPKRRNEPRWVEVTARWLADRRGIEPDLLGNALVENYDRVFGK